MRTSKQLATLVLLIHTVVDLVATEHHFLQSYLPEKGRRSRRFHDSPTRHGRGSAAEIGPNNIPTGLQTNKSQPTVFQSPNVTVVTAQTDTTVVLHCIVADIEKDTVVSWIRRKDPIQILTVGNKTHIDDRRFYASNEKNPRDWTLHLRYAFKEDEGIYECQVATHPISSIYVELHLVEAFAEILGTAHKVVKSGSPLRLSCVLHHSIEPPSYIFWYHVDRMINYDLRGGAAVRHGRRGSELIFPRAVKSLHEGNYSCVPSNTRQASVTVEVREQDSDVENSAAMKHGGKGGCGQLQPIDRYLIILLLILAVWGRR